MLWLRDMVLPWRKSSLSALRAADVVLGMFKSGELELPSQQSHQPPGLDRRLIPRQALPTRHAEDSLQISGIYVLNYLWIPWSPRYLDSMDSHTCIYIHIYAYLNMHIRHASKRSRPLHRDTLAASSDLNRPQSGLRHLRRPSSLSELDQKIANRLTWTSTLSFGTTQ